MGEAEVNGKNGKVEVVSGGTYKLEYQMAQLTMLSQATSTLHAEVYA